MMLSAANSMSRGGARPAHRVMLVAMLVLGLFVAMFHCASDSAAGEMGAKSGLELSYHNDSKSSPVDIDHAPAQHGNHCLSHVAEVITVFLDAPVLASESRSLPRDHGVDAARPVPLFKPPRA